MAKNASVAYGGLLIPDETGRAWWQPAAILDTNDLVPGTQVLMLDQDQPGAAGAMCPVPTYFDGSGVVELVVRWKTVGTSGNAVLTAKLKGLVAGASGDPAAWDQDLSATVAAPGTTNILVDTVFTLDAQYLTAGGDLALLVGRTGNSGSDTLTTPVQVVQVILRWRES